MVFDGFLNGTLGSLVSWNPLGALIIITFVLTFVTTLIFKFFTDQKAMKALKDEMKQIQKDMKELKNDPAKMMELQKKSFSKMMESFKHSMKPMIITFVPLLILFPWLRNTYSGYDKIFLWFGWFGTYFIFSIGFNLILRKILKVH